MDFLHLDPYDFLWSIGDEGCIFELGVDCAYIVFLVLYLSCEAVSLEGELLGVERSIDIDLYTIYDTIGVSYSLDRAVLEGELSDTSETTDERSARFERLTVDHGYHEYDVARLSGLDPRLSTQTPYDPDDLSYTSHRSIGLLIGTQTSMRP